MWWSIKSLYLTCKSVDVEVYRIKEKEDGIYRMKVVGIPTGNIGVSELVPDGRDLHDLKDQNDFYLFVLNFLIKKGVYHG